MPVNDDESLARLLLPASLALLLAFGASPALAGAMTPKEAIKIMTKAGYAGIGGVTHDLNFYYAAAIDTNNKRKRVRVTLDDETGKIVAVMPLVGAGAPPPTTTLTTSDAIPPVKVAPAPKMLFPLYQAPNPRHPIGQVQYPFNSTGTKLQPGYCQWQRNANAPGC